MSDYSNSGTADIDNILAQNAYTIGGKIYQKTLNVSRWDALIRKGTLPEGMGDSLSTLIYDRSIPTTTAGGSTVGINWTRLGTEIRTANDFSATEAQFIEGAAGEVIGSTAAARTAFIKFKKRMRNYYLSVANVKSPYIDIHTVRTAAAREQQSNAIMKVLTKATQWAWDRRGQEQYELSAGNFVPCLAASTSPILETVDIRTGAIDPVTGSAATGGTANNPFDGISLTDLELNTSGASNADVVPTANISNKVMDRIYNRLARVTDHSDAYGMDNARPVFSLVCGSDASLFLKTETGIRDDVRKSTIVDSLLKPLGVDESFRGFYHLTEDLMPRFTESGGVLTRVEPFTAEGLYDTAYDDAPYEAFYVVHKTVMEYEIPAPSVSAPGMTFDPQSYKGDFKWLNIQDEIKNPLKTIGFFYGTLAAATKTIDVEHGFVGLFLRTSTTPAL